MESPVTGIKQRTLRLDILPQNIQEQILALAAKGRSGGIVTLKQVEYTLDALENGLRQPGKSAKGWEKTNSAIAVGRLSLVFFNEHPEIKTKFRNYIGKMQAAGRVVDRGSKPESPTA